MPKPKSGTVELAAHATAEIKLSASIRIHTEMPHDHPFYANIGRIASEWAHIEHVLDVIIWDLASVTHKNGACMTSQIMGVGPRCRAICALGGLRGMPAALLKRVRTLMSDSYPIADLRAQVVHDPWFVEVGRTGGNPAQFRSMAYSDPRYGIKDITQKEMDDALEKIRKLKIVARDLRRDFANALASSPKKQP